MCEIHCLTCELQLFNDFRLTNLGFTELQLDVQAAFLAVYHGACHIVACCLANTVISYEWSATDALSPRPTTSR